MLARYNPELERRDTTLVKFVSMQCGIKNSKVINSSSNTRLAGTQIRKVGDMTCAQDCQREERRNN